MPTAIPINAENFSDANVSDNDYSMQKKSRNGESSQLFS